MRGAFIIAAYAPSSRCIPGRLAGRLGAAAGRSPVSGIPLALATAVYTAYLFAQAKARDLWQNPLLAPHLLVQAILAGAAVPAAVRPVLGAAARRSRPLKCCWPRPLARTCCWSAGEISSAHPTAHAHLAAAEMIADGTPGSSGRALAAVAVSAAAPWIGVAAVPLAARGLLAYEHAYVQAGQSVPLS